MTQTELLPGVILAGGASRRMGGRDKALVVLRGRPMLAHVVARLGPQVGGLAVNAPAPIKGFPSLPFLPDSVAERPGPLAGVLAGMEWAAGLGASRVMIAPVDVPFLPTDCVARLAGHDAPIVLGEAGGRLQPVIGLWSVALAEDLRAAITSGTRAVRDFAEAQRFAQVALGEGAAFNVNSPEDLARAEGMTL